MYLPGTCTGKTKGVSKTQNSKRKNFNYKGVFGPRSQAFPFPVWVCVAANYYNITVALWRDNGHAINLGAQRSLHRHNCKVCFNRTKARGQTLGQGLLYGFIYYFNDSIIVYYLYENGKIVRDHNRWHYKKI